MLPPRFLRKWLCSIALLHACFAFAAPLQPARNMEVRVASMDAGAVRAEGVHLRFSTIAQTALAPTLNIEVSKLLVPAISAELTRVSWRCEALVLEPLQCDGALSVNGRAAGRLAVALEDGKSTLAWAQGAHRLGLAQSGESPWVVDAQRMPLAWIQAFLDALWEGGRIGQGEVSGRVVLAEGSKSAPIRADLRLSGLGFDTPDGAWAGAGLQGGLKVAFATTGPETQVSVSGEFKKGELLVSPIYLAVPASGVRFGVTATSRADGGWALEGLDWHDANALRVRGSAQLDADDAIRRLALKTESSDLSALRQRYLDGVLAPAGFPELLLSGSGQAQVAMDEEGLMALDVALANTNAIDPRGRFNLAGLAGNLRWSRDSAVENSRLTWKGAALYGLGIESAELNFRSGNGQLALAQPMRAALLGGHLQLDRLVWQPARGGVPLSMELGLSLDDLDLGSLSQRLGWPAFEGRVGGALPRALYQNNRVQFDGGLGMSLFGGQVRIDDLVLERPFGVAPSLAANVRFDDIDLGPLTRAFGFGEITGRLDGRIGDLRLVDWTPVAFDARLLTDKQWKGARRISQRAVQDISDLGGSGLVAGVQAQVLRVFDDFGYDRIGLGCVLKDNRCRMSGLKARGAGYVVVAGRGLPRIEVVGFRRNVDWPTLLARLKAATEGQSLRFD